MTYYNLPTDNPETMPLTDAVYPLRRGRKRPTDATDRPPRGHTRELWQTLDQRTLDRMARQHSSARRFAARARKAAQ